MVWGLYGLASLSAYGFSRISLPGLLRLIQRAGFVRPNYLGKMIPVSAGLVLFLGCLPAGLAVITVTKAAGFSQLSFHGLLWLLGLLGMSLAGLIDDVFGNRSIGGFSGHWAKLFRDREITTGSLKALLGGGMALGLVCLDTNFNQSEQSLFFLVGGIILRVLVVGLMTNFLNLLDLRPGRAGKAYVLAVALLSLWAWPWGEQPEVGYLWVVLGSLLACLAGDLRAEWMLGDSGANALGFSLGLVSIWLLPAWILLIVLGLLAGLHLWAEKYSLSKLIADNTWLCYLDNLGRR